MNRGRNGNGNFFRGIGAPVALLDAPAARTKGARPGRESKASEPDYRALALAEAPGRSKIPRSARNDRIPPNAENPADLFPSAQIPLPTYQEKPVAPPAISEEEKRQAERQANLDQRTLGLSGTANLMGFLRDLGESNAAFQGLRAMDIYEKMRREDATVAALEAAIKLPIRGAEWDLLPGVEESDPGYALAKKIRDECWENLKGGLESTTESGSHTTQTFESVIENLLLSPIFGCSAHEDLWAPDADKNQIRLRGLQPLLPRTFYQFLPEADGNTLKTLIQFGYRGALVQILPVPASKICLTTFNREGSYFYGRSILRAAHMAWKFKRQHMVINAIGAEKNRIAVPTIIQGPNASELDKAASWVWVENLAANERTGLSLPNGWVFKQTGIEGRAVDLLEDIRLYDEQILDAGLAGFLYVGKNSIGARSLGDTKLNYFLMSEEALARMIADVMTSTTIRRWVDWNYDLKGDQKNLYPRLRCANICVVNVMDIIASLKDLAKSDVDWLQTSDERDNWLAKKLGVPLKTKEGRVKYAPIIERIQEMETGTQDIPTQSPEGGPESGDRKIGRSGEQKPAAGAPAPLPAGATKPGDTSKVLPTGRTIMPAKQRAAQAVAMAGEITRSPDHPITRSARIRDQVSPLWQHGDPAHLKNVHTDELHVDFAAHLAAMERGKTAVAGAFDRSKPRLIRAAAKTFAAALKKGKNLNSAAPEHDVGLENEVAGILNVAHQAGFEEARKEHARLVATGKSRYPDPLHLSDAERPVAQVLAPQLRAEISVQDVIADIAQAARKAALDLAAGNAGRAPLGPTEEELADEIYSQAAGTAYVDEGIERTAAEAANEAFRGGRSSAFTEIVKALEAAGVTPRFFRVAVLDKNVCGNCEAADGQDVDPDQDLSAICDGQDLCRCQVAEGGIG
jgi:hypothetical protein